MITRRRAVQLIGVGSAVTIGAGRRARAAELEEVKIATPLAISDAPILIAEHKGYCREQGIRTTMVSMQTGSYMVAPLGAGQLDIGAGAASASRSSPTRAPTSRAMPMSRYWCARNWSIPENTRR